MILIPIYLYFTSGWTNPSEKYYASQIGSFHQVFRENKKKIEATTQKCDLSLISWSLKKMRPEKWKHTKIGHFNIKQLCFTHIDFTQIGECAKLSLIGLVNNQALISEDCESLGQLFGSDSPAACSGHGSQTSPFLEITRWITNRSHHQSQIKELQINPSNS